MRLRVVGETMKPMGTHSLLRNILAVVGGTVTRQGDSLQMDFLVLFATEFHMVKLEETKQTKEFRERSIVEVYFEIYSKENMFLRRFLGPFQT